MATFNNKDRVRTALLTRTVSHPYTHVLPSPPLPPSFSFASRPVIVRPRNESVDIFCNRVRAPCRAAPALPITPPEARHERHCGTTKLRMPRAEMAAETGCGERETTRVERKNKKWGDISSSKRKRNSFRLCTFTSLVGISRW